MVKKLGMSEKIGYMSFKEDDIVKIYSEDTQKVLILIKFICFSVMFRLLMMKL